MPAVSIIMCAYNVSSYINQAIESILTQTFRDWELIISDDSSTDNTVALIEKYLDDKRIRLFRHSQNLGYLRNKNFACSQASAPLITQLDADDTCPPDRLEKQVHVFVKHPEIMICGGNFQLINLKNEPHVPKTYPEDFLIHQIEDTYPFWFPGLMFRSSLLKEFGLFSEYFTGIYGDDDYWVSRVNRKYPVYFLKDIIYNYRQNPGSLTNVLDNPRKLFVSEIVLKLKEQQRETGTDWLEQGMAEKMKAFEAVLLGNKRLLSEKYATWAAKAVDTGNLPMAENLLRKALKEMKTNTIVYKTLFYYLRRRFFRLRKNVPEHV